MTRRVTLPLVVVALPLAITVVATITTAVLAGGAPTDVAVHWNASGTADGFAPAWTVSVVGAASGLVFTVVGALMLALAREGEHPSRTGKFLVSAVVGASALIGTAGIWILATQQEGMPTPPVFPGIVLWFGVAIGSGLLAWWSTPPAAPWTAHDPEPAKPLSLGAAERAVWIGTARMPFAAVLAISLVALGLIVLVTVAVLQTGEGAAWPALIVPGLLGLLLLGLSRYRVRVDDEGLSVHGALGLPRWRIPAGGVESAGVVEVEPLREFGGWGVRIGRGGRTGVITRAGEALQVRRRNGRALVVTVDDAGTAAALLTTVAARASAERP